MAFTHEFTEEALLSAQEFNYWKFHTDLDRVTFKEVQTEKNKPSNNEDHFGFQFGEIKQMLAVFWESSVKLNKADGMVVCSYDSI